MHRLLTCALLLLTGLLGCEERGGGMSYLALGDSYTIGQSVTPQQRWPTQLVEMLRAEGVEIADPRFIAATGWTCDDLDAAIARQDPRGPFDLVTLLIGVNDQFQGRAVEDYAAAFERLLDRAIALAGGDPGRVILLAIPDYSVTPFGRALSKEPAQIAAELDAYNAINRAATEAAGAHYVDIAPASRAARIDPSLTADDGLHPSATLYRQWSILALPAAREALPPATVELTR